MTTAWALVVCAAAAAALAGLWVCHRLRRRNVMLWLPAYVRRDWAGARHAVSDGRPVHVIFAVADHFEPVLGRADMATQRRRVARWIEDYPRLADGYADADGRPPRHTFFYPAEEYCEEHLDRLAELVRRGYGEVEVHLHHDGDTSDGLRRSLREFLDRLDGHGLLGRDAADGERRFGFVHGNWALDNSRADGRWCGVNDELRVLAECGCYADFTLPSAPSDTQTRQINSIYYATDDPDRPKSHDTGPAVRVNGRPQGDLMIVQGPLGILWPGGKFGVLPRLEYGNLSGGLGMSPRRVDAWVRARVCVAGRPDWVFVKVHTHGCNERNWPVLLGDGAHALHQRLAAQYNEDMRYRLHYVTAREMANIIRAAERGLEGDPGQYRDLAILPPARAQDRRAADRARAETAS